MSATVSEARKQTIALLATLGTDGLYCGPKRLDLRYEPNDPLPIDPASPNAPCQIAAYVRYLRQYVVSVFDLIDELESECCDLVAWNMECVTPKLAQLDSVLAMLWAAYLDDHGACAKA